MDEPRTFEQASTNGFHALEVDSWAEFDATMEHLKDYFVVLREVSGWYLHPRAHCKPQQPRIDRIVCPTSKLRAKGWDLGPVGVECKRSGAKLGPVISQALDYGRAVFPITGGLTCCLEWILIWPSGIVPGDIGSIMTQNRIGAIEPLRNGDGVAVFLGDGYHNTISTDYGVRYRRPKCGYKTGSR